MVVHKTVQMVMQKTVQMVVQKTVWSLPLVPWQVEKDKKDCAVQLEAGTSVRHGSAYPGATPVTTLSLDCQLAGKDHRMGTVRADTKLGLLPNNKLGLGLSVTKYPDMNLIPGIKVCVSSLLAPVTDAQALDLLLSVLMLLVTR